jgi:hypothetical protein
VVHGAGRHSMWKKPENGKFVMLSVSKAWLLVAGQILR